MHVTLIETEGPWLAARLACGEEQLCVMDAFSLVDRFAPRCGEQFEVELSALLTEDEPWEAMFTGNPDKAKRLEPLGGWSYRAYGQIVSINPVVVDCGILSVPDVLDTNDPRVVGEFIAFRISRLDATLLHADDA